MNLAIVGEFASILRTLCEWGRRADHRAREVRECQHLSASSVNGVALGPIWTPLISATFEAEEVATFGSAVPMRLYPNGGEVVNA